MGFGWGPGAESANKNQGPPQGLSQLHMLDSCPSCCEGQLYTAFHIHIDTKALAMGQRGSVQGDELVHAFGLDHVLCTSVHGWTHVPSFLVHLGSQDLNELVLGFVLFLLRSFLGLICCSIFKL